MVIYHMDMCKVGIKLKTVNWVMKTNQFGLGIKLRTINCMMENNQFGLYTIRENMSDIT